MGNNWMFQTERSGWWRLWLIEQTRKHIEAKNKPAETKPTPVKKVKQPKRKLPAREGKIVRPEPETLAPRLAPEIKPVEPHLIEVIGQMHFTMFSTTVLQVHQRYNVVSIDDARRKRRKKQDEEVLLLLAA
jgi:hypothetical protein